MTRSLFTVNFITAERLVVPVHPSIAGMMTVVWVQQHQLIYAALVRLVIWLRALLDRLIRLTQMLLTPLSIRRPLAPVISS